MTDFEMTALCAKAMGLRHRVVKDGAWDAPGQPDYVHDGVYVFDEGSNLWGKTYSPLLNDEQAMALVKKFDLNLQPDHEGWCASDYTGDKVETRNPDLNRAIVECVAKLEATQ